LAVSVDESSLTQEGTGRLDARISIELRIPTEDFGLDVVLLQDRPWRRKYNSVLRHKDVLNEDYVKRTVPNCLEVLPHRLAVAFGDQAWLLADRPSRPLAADEMNFLTKL
jgi:hypothetical protein